MPQFIFGEEDFYVKIGLGAEEDLRDSLENWAVGGENRWPFSSFTNWCFFPAPKGDKAAEADGGVPFPILVYFKETHTPQEKWNEGPGAMDKVGGGDGIDPDDVDYCTSRPRPTRALSLGDRRGGNERTNTSSHPFPSEFHTPASFQCCCGILVLVHSNGRGALFKVR